MLLDASVARALRRAGLVSSWALMFAISGCGSSGTDSPIDGNGDCAAGQLLCGQACTDVTTDVSNCGQCGTQCASGQACAFSTCVSGSGGAAAGGAASTGSTPGTGNSPGAGGTVGAGGTFAAGGTVGTGSAPASGGTIGTGGATGAGGTVATGGAVGTGNAAGTGGNNDPGGTGGGGAGGTAATGGAVATGGVGGNSGTGGSVEGTGGATGGSNGDGGTGATGGATGGAGGSTSGCEPVNPNATAQARKLLCYLYEISGNHVLSGQQETSWNWNNPGGPDIQEYVTRYGKYPAVLGGDFLYTRGTTDRAIAYWQDGGIPMIRYHMGAPPGGDSFENSKGSANMGNVLTSGSNEHSSLNSKLDYVVTELLKIQDANAAVLWAPYHEFQQGGWFWWSKGTGAQFRQLWQYTFDYLVDKGVNNVVWLAPSSGTIYEDWYPEKAYYDIAGPDTYATNQPFSTMYTQARAVVGDTVPIPLHETGYVPQPSAMFPTAAPWVLWNVWAEYGPGGSQQKSSLADFESAYSSEYTITRDEIPSLK